ERAMAGEVGAADEPELVRDLAAGARGQRTIAVPHAEAARAQLAQVSERRLAGRQWKLREPVSEIFQREGQPQRQLARVVERIGEVAEQLGHGAPALEAALAVGRQPSARVIEIGLLADARE